LVQKTTFLNGVETPVYYQHSGSDRIQRTDTDGNKIYDLTDPANPKPIYLETTVRTADNMNDPVMVPGPNLTRDSVAFQGVERIVVNALGGNDSIRVDDTAATTVIRMGDGDDTILVGTVPQINDPGNKTEEYLLGIPVADTQRMTNGNSNV